MTTETTQTQNFTLVLPPNVIGGIITLLADRPYKEVSDVIASIQYQVTQQQAERQKKED